MAQQQMTINQALVMRKSLIERRNQLKDLVEKVAQDTYRGFGKEETREEASFNVQDTDQKKVNIDLALFHLDGAVKQANAVTMITMPPDFDFNVLMGGIQAKAQKQ